MPPFKRFISFNILAFLASDRACALIHNPLLPTNKFHNDLKGFWLLSNDSFKESKVSLVLSSDIFREVLILSFALTLLCTFLAKSFTDSIPVRLSMIDSASPSLNPKSVNILRHLLLIQIILKYKI